MGKKYKMHVISGVHWDREWRQPEAQSKIRLLQLMDFTIDLLERKPSYKSFCIDGGSVVLEDYLSVRPENKDRLVKLVQERRIYFDSWYTLPEMNIVAPECLVRNILIGKKVGDQYGGCMRSGFTACSYGQVAQLPQIYQGFGIENIIFYRGINRVQFPSLFVWEGKDGSRLFSKQCTDMYNRSNWMWLVHYPLVLDKLGTDLTYKFNSSHQPVHMCSEDLYERQFVVLNEDYSYTTEKDEIDSVIKTIKEQTIQEAVGRHLLGMFIEDNTGPYEFMPETITLMNDQAKDMEIVHDNWDDFMNVIISESNIEKLSVYTGEFRYPGIREGFGGLLGETQSSRIKLKLLNEQAETMLIHHAEPIASIAGMLGGFEYPSLILENAWKALLKNHAHDSICGAAVEQVHKDMLYRYSETKMISEEITAFGAGAIYKHIDLKCFKDCDYTFTIFNNLIQSRKEIIQLIVDIPKIKPQNREFNPAVDFSEPVDRIEYFDIVDNLGNNVDFVVLRKDDINIGIERSIDTPAAYFPATRRRMLLEVEIPAIGYATYALKGRKRNYIDNPKPGKDRTLIARDNCTLENENMRVNINPNGTFSIYSNTLDKKFENLHYFSDVGEVGKAHVSIKPDQDIMISSIGRQVSISMVESNNLRGVFRVDIIMPIPKAATLNGKDRLKDTCDIAISYWLTLEKGCKYLKIKTLLDNKARDHKLKVNFPTGIQTDFAASESAYSVEKRPIQWSFVGDNCEKFYESQPMNNFVDVNDGEIGLAILNRGLREYEVIDDKDRTIAITLLRTQRAYMTANADMVPDEFDKYTELHSFGEHEYHYAIYPHIGDWDEGKVLQAAYQHKVVLNALQGVPKEGQLPSTCSFIKIEPCDEIMLSAFKQSEDKKGYIMRLWNTNNKKQAVKISTVFDIQSAVVSKLDETFMREIDVKEGAFNFEILPYEISTIKLTLKDH